VLFRSARRQQKTASTRGGIGRWLSDFIDSFALPQPAFVLAGVLLVGVFTGWSFYTDAGDASETVSSYLYMNEVFNMGEWLL
jgi:hypothetical protein